MIRRTCQIAAGAVLATCVSASAQVDVLVFTKTTGFRHPSIPDGIAAVRELGEANCFGVEQTEDGADFNPANLARFQAVIFLCTTGDVLDDTQQAAFEAYIHAGGGFVGVHSASDTEPDWVFYNELLGTHIADHPQIQTATVRIEDRGNLSSADAPDPWVRTDEWYNFVSNPRPSVQVLATVDESTYVGGTMGADHPIMWCHEFQGGRSWYTAMGHTSESYAEPAFRRSLLGGILWAAGQTAFPCAADFDCNGAANVGDIFSMLTAWFAMQPRTDYNQTGTADIGDIFAFLAIWFRGC